MIFTELSHHHFKEIVTIADQVLGAHFLSVDKLKTYPSTANKKALVLLIDKKVIGFINIDIITQNKLSASILKNKESFNQITNQNNNIGFIKQVIVHPSYQKKGYGKMLIQKIINLKQTENIPLLCIAWKQKEVIPIEKALVYNNFKLTTEISNYWSEESLLQQYSCPICGSPPCKCSAAVFTKL